MVSPQFEVSQVGAILEPGEVRDILSRSEKALKPVKVRRIDISRGLEDFFSYRFLKVCVSEVYRRLPITTITAYHAGSQRQHNQEYTYSLHLHEPSRTIISLEKKIVNGIADLA